MKAGKGLCTWHSCLSVAVVGALALAVSVQGSPRAGERDKSGKSGTSRLVTGPSAQINDAVAAGATAVITLQPVNPPGAPAPAAYPPGSSIVGQTLTLGAVPARIWIEVEYTGWAPDTLKVVQVTISATDLEMDGGGYSGSAADCAGNPANGGSLSPAMEPCVGAGTAAGNLQCDALVGTAETCAPKPSRCVTWDGVAPDYFPAGTFCQPGYQKVCAADWGAFGIVANPAVDISSLNYRYGFAADLGEVPPDFNPSNAGTLVLDVPANAKGTYTIDMDETQTFLKNDGPLGADDIAIASLRPAVVVATLCGRCCRDQGSACDEGVTQAECALAGGIFGANENCPANGGPECPTCVTNADCNDNDACTQDICTPATGACTNSPIAAWNQATECCNALDGSRDVLGCADQCEAASCTLPGNRGDAQCTARTGEVCDDDNPCTYGDTCANGAGSCAGSDANLVACVDSADCAAETGVGYPCIDGFCNCTLTPDLDIEIIDGGEPNCYESGEKVTACVRVAASSSPVNGGQFLIGYDNTCLDYNATIYQAPYTNAVYGPVVNEGAGSIFLAVGVEFGAGDGPNGNADLVCFSFNKIGSCNSCQICPLNNNPQNTYLTDADGQRITVQANCSKPVYDESDMTLTVPETSKHNADCDRPTAVVTWDAPSADDECGNATVVCSGEHESGLVYDSATANGGGELPIGASSFCCTATSDGPCGTTAEGCWTVTVNDETSLDITVGLSPSSQSKPGDNLTRCIKFTLYSNCVQEPLVFSDDVSFGGMFDFVGKSTGKIKIPGTGQWDCITAQDQLHTLRSCYTFASNGSDCVNGQLNAVFSGDPRLGGNWLIGGNLDGWKKDDPNANPSLDVIDILDFGTFVSQYLVNYGFTDTPCGTPGPNADINGDGIVDLDDYAFVSSNFLTSAKQCCCGPQTASAVAVTEVSVAQLRADGYAELISADLNGDGMLNLADMAAFDQGVRPTTKAPAKGGSRTGSR